MMWMNPIHLRSAPASMPSLLHRNSYCVPDQPWPISVAQAISTGSRKPAFRKRTTPTFSAGCEPCAASLTGVILTRRSKLRLRQKPNTSSGE